MKKFAIILVCIMSLLILYSCTKSDRRWEYSKVTCEITAPTYGLEKEVFISQNRQIAYSKFAGYISNWFFSYDRILYNDNTNCEVILSISNIFAQTDPETFTLNYKYSLTSDNHPRNQVTILGQYYRDLEELTSGYIIFTKCERYQGYYRLSGKFEFGGDDITITNGTFIDIVCMSRFNESNPNIYETNNSEDI